ncbi:hypothetical protein J2T21_003818 [Paeniglutamicibacter psychrophenolicus]|nr:hypothetical protein [Paeniglutamicibacter psychrophenolicus]
MTPKPADPSRRNAEGKVDNEILRCAKRFLA